MKILIVNGRYEAYDDCSYEILRAWFNRGYFMENELGKVLAMTEHYGGKLILVVDKI